MILAQNKKANFDYEIIKTFVCGIKLSGSEVKACRNRQMNLKASYVKHQDPFLILKQAEISHYKYDTTKTSDKKKSKDYILLLNKNEIEKIIKETNNQGVTIVPLSLFTDRKYLKLKIALARGKKKYDKRESIKKKDIERKDLRNYKLR